MRCDPRSHEKQSGENLMLAGRGRRRFPTRFLDGSDVPYLLHKAGPKARDHHVDSLRRPYPSSKETRRPNSPARQQRTHSGCRHSTRPENVHHGSDLQTLWVLRCAGEAHRCPPANHRTESVGENNLVGRRIRRQSEGYPGRWIPYNDLRRECPVHRNRWAETCAVQTRRKNTRVVPWRDLEIREGTTYRSAASLCRASSS